MKIKQLIAEIEECREKYGDEFLDWDVYTEQLGEMEKVGKRIRDWRTLTDSEKWEYFECVGFWTKFPDKKIFTINVNY